MCELMGLSFDKPVSADFSIRAFACRDVDNADGWGLAWYADRSLTIVKEALTWRKSDYSRFLENYSELQSKIYIAHVRHKTTGGLPNRADTHPFSREWGGREYCFAHNGTIREHAKLSLGRFTPIGRTDSEWAFCHLLAAVAERGGLLEDEGAWRWLHERLREINRRGTLNCLFSDGERLFGYRDLHGWKGLALRKIRFREGAERHFEDATLEVSMSGEVSNKGYAFATHGLSETGWHDLALGSLVVLEGGSLLFSSATERKFEAAS